MIAYSVSVRPRESYLVDSGDFVLLVVLKFVFWLFIILFKIEDQLLKLFLTKTDRLLFEFS